MAIVRGTELKKDDTVVFAFLGFKDQVEVGECKIASAGEKQVALDRMSPGTYRTRFGPDALFATTDESAVELLLQRESAELKVDEKRVEQQKERVATVERVLADLRKAGG